MPRARRPAAPDPLPTREARQAEARRMAATGMEVATIAHALDLSEKTVGRYLRPDPPEPWSAFGPVDPS